MQLPILRKEMVEVAARKRTYVIRFIYACALFSIWLLILWQRYRVTGGDASRLDALGQELFAWLMILELASVYIFLPAMVASATPAAHHRPLTLRVPIIVPALSGASDAPAPVPLPARAAPIGPRPDRVSGPGQVAFPMPDVRPLSEAAREAAPVEKQPTTW